MSATALPHSGRVLVHGKRHAPRTLVLAHGAGVGMRSDFLRAISTGLVRRGICVVRFEFPYMVQRRATGTRRPPDREPALRQSWHQVVESLRPERLVIGGKSMGGRIASLIADEAQVGGLVCLGYPFHPAGQPHKLRTQHLASLQTPTLILQGERDRLGNRQEVAGYNLSTQIQVHWIADGDHDLAPRKRSGRSTQDNWNEAIHLTARFVHQHSP